MSEAPHPTLLGKYTLKTRLGTDRTGALWTAEDLRLGTAVTLKLLPATADGGPLRRRFKRDFGALAKLQHPNLARLLDCGLTEAGEPVLVSEPARGRPLSERLAQGALSVQTTELLLLGLLDGLAVCHRQGLVHRDLSPSTVWWVDTPAGPQAVVHDLGLSRLVAEGHGAMTFNGEIYGSPRFMAPEQWGAAESVGPRADVYSAALLGYCMLLGDHFVPSGNPLAAHEAHLKGPRPSLLETTDGTPIPARLAEVIARGASADPKQRFADAAQMAAALRGEAHAPAVAASDRPTLVEDWDRSVGAAEIGAADISTTPFNAAALHLDAQLFGADEPTLFTGPPAPAAPPAPSPTNAALPAEDTNPVPRRMSEEIQAIDRRAFEAALEAARHGERIPTPERDTLVEEKMQTDPTPSPNAPAKRPVAPRDEPLQADKWSLKRWLLIYFGMMIIGVIWGALR